MARQKFCHPIVVWLAGELANSRGTGTEQIWKQLSCMPMTTALRDHMVLIFGWIIILFIRVKAENLPGGTPELVMQCEHILQFLLLELLLSTFEASVILCTIGP